MNWLRENKIIVIILSVALLLRLGATVYGLPQGFFGDEMAHVSAAFYILQEKTITPNFSFYYLPPLFSYLLAPLLAFYGGISILAGIFSSTSELKDFIVLNREYFLIFSRITSASFGVATIWLTYISGKEIFNKKTGILASMFLAFDLISVHESQIGRIWGPTAFFFILGIYFIWKMYLTRQRKWYVWSAVSIGLGYAMGYVPALLVLLFIFAQHVSCTRPRTWACFLKDRNFLIGLSTIASLVVFFSLANTYAFWRQFGSMLIVLLDLFGIHANITIPVSATFHSTFGVNLAKTLVVFWQNNPFLLALIVFGAITLFLKEKFSVRFVFLAVFPLVYVLGYALGTMGVDSSRYFAPALPPLLILASWFLLSLLENASLASGARKGFFKASVFIVLILSLVYSAICVFRYQILLFKSDTRTQAVNWIKNNISSGERFILDESNIFLIPNKESVLLVRDVNPKRLDTRMKLILENEELQNISSGYAVYDVSRLGEDKNLMLNFSPKYLIYSFKTGKEKNAKEEAYGFFANKRLVTRFYPQNNMEDITDLLDNVKEAHRLWSFSLKYLGPFIEIYKIRQQVY